MTVLIETKFTPKKATDSVWANHRKSTKGSSMLRSSEIESRNSWSIKNEISTRLPISSRATSLSSMRWNSIVSNTLVSTLSSRATLKYKMIGDSDARILLVKGTFLAKTCWLAVTAIISMAGCRSQVNLPPSICLMCKKLSGHSLNKT